MTGMGCAEGDGAITPDSDNRRWTWGHPDGPRLDVDGVAWFACDPYPTWYRWGNSGLAIARPRFPKASHAEGGGRANL